MNDEVKVIGRVVYKNKNQHRKLQYFQVLQMAYRKLTKLQAALALHESLKQACLAMLAKAKTSKEVDLDLLKRTLDATVLAANLHPVASKYCVLAAQRLSGLVAKGWFLTFAVIALASVCKAESFCVGGGERLALEFQDLATSGLRRFRHVCLLQAAGGARENNQLAVSITRLVLEARQGLSPEVLALVREKPKLGTGKRAPRDDDLGETVKRAKPSG